MDIQVGTVARAGVLHLIAGVSGATDRTGKICDAHANLPFIFDPSRVKVKINLTSKPA
jgi:hypothetical protein